jgi:hypothetical protein
MTLSSYERNNTIKVDVDFKSNNVLTNVSGNMAFIDVYKSDATKLVDSTTTPPASGQHTGTGEYTYYFTPSATDPLGIYVVQWSGYSYIDATFGWQKISQRDPLIIRDTYQD